MPVTPNSIVTPQTPRAFAAVATTGETAFHSPTNAVTLIDESVAGVNDNGLRLTSLTAVARAAVTTNPINCQLYRKVGATLTLIDSVTIPVGTPSASVASPKADFGVSEDNPLVLEPGAGLAVAIGSTVANGVVFHTHGGAY